MARRRGNRVSRFKANHPYNQEVLAVHRVARVVKGGRRFRFRALVVLGDGQGLVGVGLGKGSDVSTAITKAGNVAQNKMFNAIIDQTTVPHDVIAKVGGAQVLIKPAKEGTGLIAGGTTRLILETAGYSNIYSKSLGNSNKINTAYAVIKALKQLVGRDDWLTTKVSRSTTKQPLKQTDNEDSPTD